MFNATFNNSSVISWQSVLLVEETGGPGENHRHVASHWQAFSHNVVSSTPSHERDSNSQLTNLSEVCQSITSIWNWLFSSNHIFPQK